MLIGFLFAILASLLLASNTFCLDKLDLHMKVKETTFFVLFTGLLFNIIYNFIFYQGIFSIDISLVNTSTIIILLISGILGYYFSYLLILVGAKYIGIAKVTLISSLSILFVYAYEIIFLSSQLEISKIIWSIAIITGIVFTFKDNTKEKKSIKQFTLGIIASLALALCQTINILIIKSAVDANILSSIDINIVRLMIATLISFILFIIPKLKNRKQPKDSTIFNINILVLLFLASFLGPFLSVIFQNLSLSLSPASITNAVTQLYPIFILLLKVIIDKEQLNIKVLFGCMLAVMGAIMFSF